MASRNERSPKQYYQLVKGRLAQFVKTPTETSTEVENKNGVKRHYEFFDYVVGKIKKFYTYEKEYTGYPDVETLVIEIQEADGDSVIEIPMHDQSAQDLIKRICNEKLDLTEDVTIKFFPMKDKEKSKTSGKDIINNYSVIYQNDEKIEGRFKKGDLPEFKKVKQKNTKTGKMEEVWDMSDYMEALRGIVAKVRDAVKEGRNLLPF